MIPIFIITCNRLKVLKESIQSYYDFIKTPFGIVIIDFGSTYEPTLEFLKHLNHKKVKIYWKKKINHKFDLRRNNINGIIQDYFKDHPKSNYVVTDPDIALDNVEGDVLNVYNYLLESLPKVNVVGPMLRIDDIPDYYPKKKKLISSSRHVKFHSSKVHIIQYKDKAIKYIFAPIDTTFGMFRAGTHWMALRSGSRVLSPYSAKHLDWYLDPENLTQDQKYYREHASKKIAHWSFWKQQEVTKEKKE